MKIMLNYLGNFFKRFAVLLKNKILVAFIIFTTWMLFFDANNIISQAKLGAKLKSHQQKKTFYQQRIIEVKTEKEELKSNSKTREKFAREKYWMKKDNEDLYIIIPKDE